MSNVACKISNAEWQVMKVFWEESPLTAPSVIKHLKPETNWSPKTIQTLIGRLVTKGALGLNKDAAMYQYYPLISQEECMREETKSFLQKVYGGSFHLMLANFVKNENLSAKEIEELRNMLDKRMK
jgi:Predicted transcriptional regulator